MESHVAPQGKLDCVHCKDLSPEAREWLAKLLEGRPHESPLTLPNVGADSCVAGGAALPGVVPKQSSTNAWSTASSRLSAKNVAVETFD
jgi:hypothetical protein